MARVRVTIFTEHNLDFIFVHCLPFRVFYPLSLSPQHQLHWAPTFRTYLSVWLSARLAVGFNCCAESNRCLHLLLICSHSHEQVGCQKVLAIRNHAASNGPVGISREYVSRVEFLVYGAYACLISLNGVRVIIRKHVYANCHGHFCLPFIFANTWFYPAF